MNTALYRSGSSVDPPRSDVSTGAPHPAAQPTAPQTHAQASTLALALAALGVVFGDIGTSPLYAIKECFHGLHAIAANEMNILGVLSLVFWSLTIVVTIKYVAFILRADNKGEGGIYALLALIPPKSPSAPKLAPGILLIAIFGAALLFGDGIITPAISVLSAIEGLTVATEAATPVVLPLTCLVLFMLFYIQRRGTASIGKIFGPVMIGWFSALAGTGAWCIAKHPHVLSAVNPIYAIRFFGANGLHAVVVLGSVVLCITGGEALYADLGHFGRQAIRLSWLAVAGPCLLLNYFGQGAALLADPEAASNPFYSLVPHALLYPMVALATAATVIASQAMISGVFSLTQQAVQLGFLPRMQIVHTSSATKGQIYIPLINWTLMVLCLALVLVFGNSSRLAGAYGIAVTATMGISSLLYGLVIHRRWKWSLWTVVPLVGLFLAFDLAFFGANLFKLVDGGWFTLLVGWMIMVVMTTWRDGRAAIAKRIWESRLPLESFLADIVQHRVNRVDGTAIFLTVSPRGVPASLLHFFKHTHVLHERILLVSIQSTDEPKVSDDERLTLNQAGQGFYRLVASYGFMEKPDVPAILRIAARQGVQVDPHTCTYFLGRETLLTNGPTPMCQWRKFLFLLMSRLSQTAMGYFGIPVNRVMELGLQISL